MSRKKLETKAPNAALQHDSSCAGACDQSEYRQVRSLLRSGRGGHTKQAAKRVNTENSSMDGARHAGAKLTTSETVGCGHVFGL